MHISSKKQLAAFALLLGFSACSAVPDWLGGEEDKKRLPGERKPALMLQSEYKADPALMSISVMVPEPKANDVWISASQAIGEGLNHIKLSGDLSQAAENHDAAGAGEDLRLSAGPVIAEGKVFILDGQGNIIAYDAQDIRKTLWKTATGEQAGERMLGGGLAYENGRIFAALPQGDVVAADAATGEIVWRKSSQAPLRSAPTAANGMVYVLTSLNQLYALSGADGMVHWMHTGAGEPTTLLKAPSPVMLLGGKGVLAAYASGELYALRAETGEPVWTASLASTRKKGAAYFSLNDISATPISEGKALFATSHSGLFAAIDATSGQLIWPFEAGSLSSPWVGGEFVFMVTTDNILLCLHKPTGKVKWSAQLDKYEDPEKQKGKVVWNGPVLAGDRLILVRTGGILAAYSPKDGKEVQRITLGEPVYAPLSVANDTLYLLTNNGRLIARR